MAGVGTGKKARNGYRLSTTFVSIQDIIVLTFIIRGILYKREFGRLVQAIRRGPAAGEWEREWISTDQKQIAS